MEDQTLRIDVQHLTRRVEQLEHAVGELRGAPQAEVEATRDLWADSAAWKPTQAPVRPTPPPPPPPAPAREPIDWGALAARVFTARTLAWAGGIATVLGIVLLFVMAASRGWVTPSMRVGIGVIVSVALLAAALELDRRSWRADAILAAAGAGIAGLYASLWASTWLYHLLSGAAASPLAAVIAGVAVAVAIRIRQEPLAVFGITGAMVAPVLVSLDVTAAGLLFAAAMMAAVLPIYAYQRWSWLVIASSAIGFAEALALLGVSADPPSLRPGGHRDRGRRRAAGRDGAPGGAAARHRAPADVARRPDRLGGVHAFDGRRVPVRRDAHGRRPLARGLHAGRHRRHLGAARLCPGARPPAARRSGGSAGGVRPGGRGDGDRPARRRSGPCVRVVGRVGGPHRPRRAHRPPQRRAPAPADGVRGRLPRVGGDRRVRPGAADRAAPGAHRRRFVAGLHRTRGGRRRRHRLLLRGALHRPAAARCGLGGAGARARLPARVGGRAPVGGRRLRRARRGALPLPAIAGDGLLAGRRGRDRDRDRLVARGRLRRAGADRAGGRPRAGRLGRAWRPQRPRRPGRARPRGRRGRLVGAPAAAAARGAGRAGPGGRRRIPDRGGPDGAVRVLGVARAGGRAGRLRAGAGDPPPHRRVRARRRRRRSARSRRRVRMGARRVPACPLGARDERRLGEHRDRRSRRARARDRPARRPQAHARARRAAAPAGAAGGDAPARPVPDRRRRGARRARRGGGRDLAAAAAGPPRPDDPGPDRHRRLARYRRRRPHGLRDAPNAVPYLAHAGVRSGRGGGRLGRARPGCARGPGRGRSGPPRHRRPGAARRTWPAPRSCGRSPPPSSAPSSCPSTAPWRRRCTTASSAVTWPCPWPG